MAVPVLVLLLIAHSLWLTQLGMNGIFAHLLSAVVGLLASVALGFIGKSYLTPENLVPRVTLRQVEKDVVVAKEMAR